MVKCHNHPRISATGGVDPWPDSVGSESPPPTCPPPCPDCRGTTLPADGPWESEADDVEVKDMLRLHHLRMEQRLDQWMRDEERMLQHFLAQRKLFKRPVADLSPRDCSDSIDSGDQDHRGKAKNKAKTPHKSRTNRSSSSSCSNWSKSLASPGAASAVASKPSKSRGAISNSVTAEDWKRRNAAYGNSTTSASTPRDDDEKRSLFHRVVAGTYFELVFGVCIVSNAILIGIEVEYTSSRGIMDAPLVFKILNYMYGIVFLCELVCRVAHEQDKFVTGPHYVWNALDFLIVACSMVEMVMDILFIVEGGAGGASGVGNVRILRLVRITRLMRITRISRLMRFIKALRTLVYSIMVTLKSLVWAMLLIVILMYVFGILFTQTINDAELDMTNEHHRVLVKYWGTLGKSMTTLFKSVSNGLSWQEASDPMHRVNWFLEPTFYIYISFAYFAVLNVVTGVFCQSAIESAQRDQDMLMQAIMANKQQHVRKVKALFANLDSDQSGAITLRELEARMEDDEVKAYFNSLELDVHDAWTFFKLLDTDEGHTVEAEEFIMGCMRLRGPAKALDVAKLIHENQMFSKHLTDFMVYVETALIAITRSQGIHLSDSNSGSTTPRFNFEQAGRASYNSLQSRSKSLLGELQLRMS